MRNAHIATALAALSLCATSHAQLSTSSLIQLLSDQGPEKRQLLLKILAAVRGPINPVDCTSNQRPQCDVKVEINEFDIGTTGQPEIICTARLPGVSLKGHPTQTIYWTLVPDPAGRPVDIGNYRYHQVAPMIVIKDKKRIVPKNSMETGGLVAQFDVEYIEGASATFAPLILRETSETRGDPSLCFVGDPKVVNN